MNTPTRSTCLLILSMILASPSGAQWIKQSFPSTEILYKVRFANPQTGWILGAANLYKTTDGGASWYPQKTTQGYGQTLHVASPDVIFHGNFNGPLERSTDGGATWNAVHSDATSYFDFDFISPTVGYAAGGIGSPMQSVIRKTTDGGVTWTNLSSPFTGGEIEGLSFVDENTGWAVTYWGLMYKTSDGGQSWSFQDTVGRANFNYNAPVRDAQFASTHFGWAVGGLSGNNVIARTTDGGASWTYQRPGGSSWREIHMRNTQRGWIVGATYAPYIVRTTNGGETWEAQTFSSPPNPSRGLESIFMIDDNLGWAVGGMGDLYKTTNGGTSPTSVKTSGNPLAFKLEQNYPNPFNPTTSIKFQIPSSNHVTLRVFDILGREVATLVDEMKEAGEHIAIWNGHTFDGSQAGSGVYFVRAETQDHTTTGRMMLLR